MRANFLRRRLARRPLRVLLFGVALALFCVVGLVLVLWDAGRGTIKRNDLLSILIFVATESVLVLTLVVGAAFKLMRAHDCDHRDIRALGRYGVPVEMVAAIDAEVQAGRRLLRLGTLETFFNPFPDPGEFRGHQIILTESWLLDFWRYEGDRFHAVRLPDLVCAAPSPGALGRGRTAGLVLIDRHDVRLEIVGKTAAVGRLLAEVLARVPWALERFDPQTERDWGQDRTCILSEVDRRREQFRGGQPGAPTAPA
jgi:hypothetical protein